MKEIEIEIEEGEEDAEECVTLTVRTFVIETEDADAAWRKEYAAEDCTGINSPAVTIARLATQFGRAYFQPCKW